MLLNKISGSVMLGSAPHNIKQYKSNHQGQNSKSIIYLRISMEDKLNYLLDRNRPFEEDRVKLLDELTIAMSKGSPEASQAHEIWRRLKEDDYFWYNSDRILEGSQVHETKVFTLVILEEAIKQKWFALPENQRQSLKSYIVNVVIEYGAIENISRQMHNILSKANSVLVQIVKYQWNTTWKSFINDICSASLKDMNLCQNNFSILKMLSEEIFDYSKNQMTQQQIADLKKQMVDDFKTIFDLCNLVLDNMTEAKTSLVRACLETLHAFLSWIPMYFIIYTNLIEKLIFIIQSEPLRSYSLSCLVEIASLPISGGDSEEVKKYIYMLMQATIQLNKILPLTTDRDEIARLKAGAKKKWHVFQILARNITMFYSQFFKEQVGWLERAVEGNQEMIQICKGGFNYLIMMMKLDDDQAFKISIQFFHFYVGSYLERQSNGQFQGTSAYNSQISLHFIYRDLFLQVMRIISLKMAKPEQVLIVIDEDGCPVREEIENTQNSSLYEIMRELASYLVKINWPEMKKFILTQIESQQTPELFSFDALNSLSWIVGSLCGSILEKEEKSFFISTLRTLLHLCEMKKGKENKAVIASCIMYVVGQYPTFLRNNWTFLRTVVRKLFEFMREDYPGIMEMACNAFLKIAKNTADQFVIVQLQENQAYVREVIRKIPEQTEKLSNDTLRLTFYESVGYLIGAETNSNVQLQLMKQALGYHHYQFNNIIGAAQGNNTQVLLQEEVKRKVLFFLKINEMLATGVGNQYALFLQQKAETFNTIYLYYSKQVNDAVAKNNLNVLNYMTIKIMRSIKKQVIKIYIRYLQKCANLSPEQANYILTVFIYPLGTLLKDFENCIPETKEQQFVALFTVVLEKLHMVIAPDFLSTLLEMIFRSSLPLITTDFNSFPQIRSNFFAFLKALIKYNFNNVFSLDQNQFNLVLDCIIWSLRHQLSNYSDLGLDLLEEILNNVNKDINIMNIFYQKYHLKILTDILDVMTDGYHKSGLETQSKIFYILIQVVSSNSLANPISSEQQGMSNPEFLYNFLAEKLSMAFPKTSKALTMEKVSNWFKQPDEQSFKNQIGDYLVLINRFSPQEISQSQQQQPQNQNQNQNLNPQ